LVKYLTQGTNEMEPTLSNYPTNESPNRITARVKSILQRGHDLLSL
jgi:hypothetical protein